MRENSITKIYGVLGYPAKHSFSPAMHNAAFKYLKVKARYEKFEKSPQDLDGFLKTLSKNNIYGLNVTIPYKEKVLPYLNGYKSYGVRTIGAANTIVVEKNGKLKGFNTDYLGFYRHISELGLRPKRVAIIGAGGAAKAICYILAKKNAAEIYIYDIQKYKALDLVKKYNELFPECRFRPAATLEGLGLKDKDLLINASPVGMRDEDPLLIEASMLDSGIFVYDLIYNPPETKLLTQAKDKGCRYANGLGMLLYQGVESLGFWIKPKKPPIETMRQALEEAVKRC